MKIDSLIFDLDGTLTDPKEGITKSVQYALSGDSQESDSRRTGIQLWTSA